MKTIIGIDPGKNGAIEGFTAMYREVYREVANVFGKGAA